MNRLLAIAPVALICLAAACSSGGGGGGTPTPTPTSFPTPTPTLTVTVTDSLGRPQAGATVLVGTSAGTLLQTFTTDPLGTVQPTIAAGEMVSVGRYDATNKVYRLQTVTQVKPGDHLTFGTDSLSNDLTSQGSMTFNNVTFAGATGYNFQLTRLTSGGTNPSFTVPVPKACLTSAGTIDVLETAVDAGGNVLAWTSKPATVFVSGGSVTMGAWQTPTTWTFTSTQAPLGSTAVSFGQNFLGASGTMAGHSAGQTLTAGGGASFSFTGPGPTALERNERYLMLQMGAAPGVVGPSARTNEILIRGTTAGTTDADFATDLLPTITAASLSTASGLTRPTLLVGTTSGSAGAAMVVEETWTSTAVRKLDWTVFGPANATSFPFPEVPAPYAVLTTDTAMLQTANMIDSSTLSGYDALRQTLVVTPPYLPSDDSRQRISTLIFNPM